MAGKIFLFNQHPHNKIYAVCVCILTTEMCTGFSHNRMIR